MKARKLKEILNNTRYTVAFYDKYIGIGSPLCHDLIKISILDFKLSYALDTWRKGRESVLHHKELTFIWDKLNELIISGEINEIIDGQDVIENPLPVYAIRDGKLISTFTDAYGWPNTTIDGYMMHDNDYFKTAGEAIEYGIKEYEYRIANLSERIVEVKQEVDRLEFVKQDCINIINGLKLLNPSGKADVNYNMNNNFDPNAPKEQEAAGAAAEAQAANEGNEQATEQSAEETTMENTEETGEE